MRTIVAALTLIVWLAAAPTVAPAEGGFFDSDAETDDSQVVTVPGMRYCDAEDYGRWCPEPLTEYSNPRGDFVTAMIHCLSEGWSEQQCLQSVDQGEY